MKRLNELTEEEIIREALRAVPEYMERIRSTGTFNLETCVYAEVKRIERLYKECMGILQHSRMTRNQIHDMDAYTSYFVPVLMEKTLPIQQRYMQQRRVSQLNAITARALIPEEFKKVGLKAEVTGQKYRAKVVVTLPATNVRFYVRYKDIWREGIMDEVIRAVLDLKEAINRLGPGVLVSKY